jgi:hypothetical protein
MTESALDDRATAAVGLIGHTGAKHFELRYSEPEDGHVDVVIWMAIAEYDREGRAVHEVGASTDPSQAIFRLCDQLIDGGHCTHCHRPSGFSEDAAALPLDEHICWTQWDPELKKYRRGCEGDA